MKIDLSKLLEWLNIDSPHLDIEVSGLCLDSRKITPGDVFVALSGFDNHGIKGRAIIPKLSNLRITA